jgi:molecular chaperone DnaJ
MDNPYETLGIKPGASEAEIKAAYREMVKKYHPDKYQNNPLGDLAKEKMQEINEAYDYLTKNPQGGGSASSYTYGGSSYQNGSSGYQGGGGSAFDPQFREIRRTIDSGNIAAAEARLYDIKNRNAEWHYLFGMCQLRKGWYDQAVGSIQTATSMDPQNMEYRNALNNIMARTGGYAQNSYQRGYGDAQNQLCQCMSCYCCTDMCCDCI